MMSPFSHSFEVNRSQSNFWSNTGVGFCQVLTELFAKTLLLTKANTPAKKITKPNFEYFNFGKAFSAAFLVGVVAMIIALIYSLLFNSVIDPDFGEWMYDEKMQEEIAKLEDRGIDDATIEQSMAIADKFKKYTTGTIGAILMSGLSLFWYAILALIVGAIQKENKQS